VADDSLWVHATCVAIGGRGVVITGASGAGKSALGLQLIALGADLVADDRVELLDSNGLMARGPATTKGLIEARFVGILRAQTCDTAQVVLAVDMDHRETERLPIERKVTYLGYKIPLLWGIESIHFAPALVQILRHGAERQL